MVVASSSRKLSITLWQRGQFGALLFVSPDGRSNFRPHSRVLVYFNFRQRGVVVLVSLGFRLNAWLQSAQMFVRLGSIIWSPARIFGEAVQPAHPRLPGVGYRVAAYCAYPTSAFQP